MCGTFSLCIGQLAVIKVATFNRLSHSIEGMVTTTLGYLSSAEECGSCNNIDIQAHKDLTVLSNFSLSHAIIYNR